MNNIDDERMKEHTNCSCPNCVPNKMYQLPQEQVSIDNNPRHFVLNIKQVVITGEEYDRLKRLDENVNSQIQEFKEAILEIEEGVSDYCMADDYYFELKIQKRLLESLNK